MISKLYGIIDQVFHDLGNANVHLFQFQIHHPPLRNDLKLPSAQAFQLLPCICLQITNQV